MPIYFSPAKWNHLIDTHCISFLLSPQAWWFAQKFISKAVEAGILKSRFCRLCSPLRLLDTALPLLLLSFSLLAAMARRKGGTVCLCLPKAFFPLCLPLPLTYGPSREPSDIGSSLNPHGLFVLHWHQQVPFSKQSHKYRSWGHTSPWETWFNLKHSMPIALHLGLIRL